MAHPDQPPETERLVLFSDAVIAITITLMVLEIRLQGDVAEMTDAALWEALFSIWPRFLSYLLSFVVIGSFWIIHHRKFELITRVSPMLMWLNLAFLCAIGLMPFVTDVLAENGGRLATATYAALVMIVGCLSAAITIYAASAGLTREPISPLHYAWRSLAPVIVFGLSIPIAYFDADAAKYVWLALIPANIAVRWFAAPDAG